MQGFDDEEQPDLTRPATGRERLQYWITRILLSLFVGAIFAVIFYVYGVRRHAYERFGISRAELSRYSILGGAVVAALLIVFGFGRINPRR
jgi:hypothetical protein